MTADLGAFSLEELSSLQELLGLLRELRGVDFGGYRVATLARRVRNRMIAANLQSLDAYLGRLRDDPAEPDALIERLTIKVSRFFRGAGAFEAVARALEARRQALPGRRLAVWSAGCGQGEEPYSLAMLLDGLQPPGDAPDVTATDLDPAALAAAAAATYRDAALEELPAALRAQHLVRRDGRWEVAPALRRRVRLLRDDLTVAAPPPGAFDLVACRNTLIYFQPALQERVLERLAGALVPGGLLWLGEAEWLAGAVASRFGVVDRRARLFEARTCVAAT
ncbi:MAG: chemotaxis protein CheR [Planctomycetes bacterium]|nr:chemotaxis protein CheR [Planctomycetota bacterium]